MHLWGVAYSFKTSAVGSLTFAIFTDLCGYVRSLLEVEKDVFNLKPIAQKLKTPDELVNQITKSLKDEDENLDMILQHWLKENDVVEDLSVLRKHLEDLQEKGFHFLKLFNFFLLPIFIMLLLWCASDSLFDILNC